MTDDRARQVANVVMAAAAIGAAVLVLRSPKLRRIAWQLARHYATGPLAAWTATTVRQAWDESSTAADRNRSLASADTPAGRAAPARFTG